MGREEGATRRLANPAVISTRVFARYGSLWAGLTPTLEHVVRWMNANSQMLADRVPATGGEPANNALIAETAFALVASGENPVGRTIGEGDVRKVREHLKQFGMNPPSDNALDVDELEEVARLATSMCSILAQLGGTATFWPVVPGCGVVDTAHADILIADTLYEVKTVTRPFRGADIRQLLTYSAMFEASGRGLQKVGLLNPRLGTGASVSLDFVCQGASGLTRHELMREIARRMAEMQVSG